MEDTVDLGKLKLDKEEEAPKVNELEVEVEKRSSNSSTLEGVVCVDDFERLAKFKLKRVIYDYICSGADDELTLKRNRQMISERYCLRPRALCNVTQVDITKYIFGDKLAMPIGVSPTALHQMMHPDGELGTVRACDQLNALMIHSLFSTTKLEELAKAAPVCTKWQNIYLLKNRELTQTVVSNAIRYGYRALVVTCDASTLGTRRNDIRNQFRHPDYSLVNIDTEGMENIRDHSDDLFDPSITWHDLAELKKSVGDTIRVIAKGIMCAEDAELALEAGVDGIFVSNHGGRQLDRAPSTIEVLPEVVKAVNKRCPVFVDGGFRTGADILIALALGADMVFVGRPPLLGLACFGEKGAYTALDMLRNELVKSMKFCGLTKLSDIKFDRTIRQRVPGPFY